MNRAHAFEFDDIAAEIKLRPVVDFKGRFLLPSMNVKNAEFERVEAEALAVVDKRGRSSCTRRPYRGERVTKLRRVA
jgi:hypothetical protein